MISRRALLLFLPLLLRAASIPLQPGAGFEQNKGQFPPEVLFAARPAAYVTATSLVLPPVTITWAGGNPAPSVATSDPLPYTVNIFQGADPSKWITGVRRYPEVRLTNIYPGIDLVYTSRSFLTFQFVVRPGASISAIHLAYTGATVYEMVEPAAGGDGLVISLPTGHMGQNTTAWQQTASGQTVRLGVHYRSETSGFAFTLDNYDPALPVTIESTLPFGVAGVGSPNFQARSGALFGFAAESPLASLAGGCTPAVPVYSGCSDAVVTKWSSTGVPLWLSYLAGAAADIPAALDVDAAGNPYAAGATTSADFPVTANAAQRAYAGPAASTLPAYDYQLHGDGFLARLDGATGMLLYSTYLGGPADDRVTAVHLDASGNAFLGGPAGAGLPTTPGALRTTPCIGPAIPGATTASCPIGYIARLDPAGRLAYLTYLPAAPSTFTVDRQGGVYFAGSAAAGELPVTPGAYRSAPVHDRDPFVARLTPEGRLAYATYYPAPASYPAYSTFVTSIAVDSTGSAWFDGPCCAGQTIGESDLRLHEYLAKLKPDGGGILYSTPFIQGALAIDANDGLSVFTTHDTPQVIHTPGGVVASSCGDPTITKLASDGTVLLNRPVTLSAAAYSGFLTQDANLAYPSFSQPPGVQALEILPIAPGPLPDAACLLNAASLSLPDAVAPGEIVTIPGRGFGPAPATRVLFDGAPAPVLYAGDGQINAIAPFNLTPGSTVTVTVETRGRATPPLNILVKATQPALFTLDGSGGGPAIAFNQDGTLNTPQNPAQLGSILTVFATGTGATDPPSVAGAVAPSIDARPIARPLIELEGVALLDVLYYGPSPGSLTSITQLNLRLPSAVPPYFPLLAWPLFFTTGGPPSQVPTISLKQ